MPIANPDVHDDAIGAIGGVVDSPPTIFNNGMLTPTGHPQFLLTSRANATRRDTQRTTTTRLPATAHRANRRTLKADSRPVGSRTPRHPVEVALGILASEVADDQSHRPAVA
jgi:hypothetical protein